MKIITRAQWGFDGWNGSAPARVNERTQRTEFFVHYNGPATSLRNDTTVPRSIHRYHKSNGWKGIGYGHVVTPDGTIYEGRGFDLVGSHCPNHNTSGYSAQVYIGGTQKPTDAALAAVRWLYDEARRRSGRTLAKRGHRDGFATSCPGEHLYAWVRAGMPVPTSKPAPPKPAPTALTSQLRRGDSGAEVELLQKMLNTVAAARLTVDGAFGPGTEAAVVAASRAWALPEPHNVVGPGFRRRMNTEWTKTPASPPPPPAPVRSWFDMATKDDLRTVVREELNAALTNEQMWRQVLTGMSFFKDPTTPNRGESPDEPRIPLGRLLELAAGAAIDATDTQAVRDAFADAVSANLTVTVTAEPTKEA